MKAIVIGALSMLAFVLSLAVTHCVAADDAAPPAMKGKAWVFTRGESQVIRVEGIYKDGPSPGHFFQVARATPQGANPKILILNARLRQLPGIWPQVITPLPIYFSRVAEADEFSQVTIRLPNNQTVTMDIIKVED